MTYRTLCAAGSLGAKDEANDRVRRLVQLLEVIQADELVLFFPGKTTQRELDGLIEYVSDTIAALDWATPTIAAVIDEDELVMEVYEQFNNGDGHFTVYGARRLLKWLDEEMQKALREEGIPADPRLVKAIFGDTALRGSDSRSDPRD